MTAEQAKAQGFCGGTNRKGRPCTRLAGWGTDHMGHGNCKYHTGSTPNGKKAAAKEAIGSELERLAATGWHIAVECDPLDGLLQVIQGAAGQVAHANALVEREAAERDGGPQTETTFALQMLKESQHELARYCKMALDAGIADRRVKIAQRHGELIAGAIERAMGKMAEQWTSERRAEFARYVEAEMLRLERGDYEEGE